jgi:hypothetical protein
MKAEYITVTFLIKHTQYPISFTLHCCNPICSNSTYILGGNIKKIQASFHCSVNIFAPRWYLYFDVVVGLAWSNDPESYAGGSFATRRVSHAGQVEGDDSD